MPGTVSAQVAQYELEIEIAARPDRVWQAMTEEANAWWLPDFHMVGADSVVRFEPVAGGHLVEERPGGGSLLWYTVQMATPGEVLYLVGSVAADFGGPATSMLKLQLEARGDGCVLQVSDALVGRVDESTAQSLCEGWRQLFTDGLKQYVEGGGAG